MNRMKIGRIEEELSSFYRFFTILGLHYFDVNEKFDDQNRRPLKFWILFVGHITFWLLYGYSTVHFKLSYDDSQDVDRIFKRMIYFMVDLLVFLITFKMILVTFRAASEEKKILKMLEQISEIFFFNLDHEIDYKKFSKEFRISSILVVTLYLLTLNLSVYVDWLVNGKLHRNVLIHYLLIVATIIVCLKICFYTYLIAFNLQETLSVLTQLTKEDLITVFCTRNSIGEMRLRPSSNTKFAKLKEIKKIYGMIFDMSNIINGCYGWILLLLMIVSTLSLTTNGFYAIMIWRNNFSIWRIVARSLLVTSMLTINFVLFFFAEKPLSIVSEI